MQSREQNHDNQLVCPVSKDNIHQPLNMQLSLADVTTTMLRSSIVSRPLGSCQLTDATAIASTGTKDQQENDQIHQKAETNNRITEMPVALGHTAFVAIVVPVGCHHDCTPENVVELHITRIY